MVTSVLMTSDIFVCSLRNFATVFISYSDKKESMLAMDWQERLGTPEKYPDVNRTKAHERQTGRFNLATIVVALNVAIILLTFRLRSGFLTFLGLFALALLFYVALILSIYVFHKPARWAFLGILDSLILAYAVHWIL